MSSILVIWVNNSTRWPLPQRERKKRHKPQWPAGGAQTWVDEPTLCGGRPACCPEGKVSHWLQQDAPPSQKAPAPPLTKKQGTLKAPPLVHPLVQNVVHGSEISPSNRYGWSTHFLRFIRMFSSRFLLPCSFPKASENRDSRQVSPPRFAYRHRAKAITV